MARFRLSSDILSPLNSDISLNDGSRSRSAFSFGSLPSTPIFDCNFASPICSASTKETNIDLLCARNMKECVDAFDEITNDIRKQSSINSEKEEKYKETYEDLKRSMDDLFGKKSDSSVFSPELQNNESKNEDLESRIHFKLNTVEESLNSENPNLTKKNKSPCLENLSKNIERKAEKCKKEKSVRNKLTKNQSEQTSSRAELVKSTKNKNEVHVRNSAVVNEKKDSLSDQKKKTKKISSKYELQNNESKNEDLESKIHFKLNTVQESLNSENPNLTKKTKSPCLENISKNIERKAEKCKKEKSVRNKLTKNQSEQTSSGIELVKSTKNKTEVHVRNSAVANEKKDSLNDQKKKSKNISSKTDGSSLETKQISSKIVPEKKKETVDVKKYNFKCQKKIPVTNNNPINEHKSISIEKSIQLAVSMEMDHIRRTVLDQNLYMQKDLMKIKEMVKKQNEVTEYLFSVVDTLLDANKELISKCG